MAVVCGKCSSSFPQETAMIRSRTVNKIHELAAQGKSIQDIAIQLGIARNTVRKYLRHPELCAMPRPRPNRRSKLDPFKEQVKQWIKEDHCYNCEAMLPRLLDIGYTGSLSVLKAFVHPLRPPQAGHHALPTSWPPSASRHGSARRIHHKRRAKSSAPSGSSNRTSGQESASAISMTSTARPISGVSASIVASIAPPTNAPESAASRRSSRLFRRL